MARRELKKISYSFLHTLACPYAAFLRYEAAIKGPTTEFLALGNAMHYALEESHREMEFDLPHAIKLFLKEFRRIIADEDVFVSWPKIKKMEGDGMTMLETYSEQLSSGIIIPPTYVEQEFSLVFEDIEIVGKIDAIVNEDELIVTDYKSGSTKPDAWFLRHNLQLTAYAWAAKELFGRLPDRLIWHHLRTGELLPTVRTDTDIDDLKQMVRNALLMNKQGMRHRIFHEKVCGQCEYSGLKGGQCDDRELERSIVGKAG